MNKSIMDEIFWLEDRIITRIECDDMNLAEVNKILKRLEKMYENIEWAKEDYLEEEENE